MAANTQMTISSEGTPDQSLEFPGRWSQLSIDSVDRNGDVAIEFFSEDNGSSTFRLDQEQLKTLITHLQNQVK